MVLKFLKRDDVLSQWNLLDSLSDISNIETASHSRTQIIFKHSTRCSISQMAFNRINKVLKEVKSKAEVHYLDLLRHRDVSDAIAKHWDIPHESPQLLIIKNGKLTYHASHSGIQPDETINQL